MLTHSGESQKLQIKLFGDDARKFKNGVTYIFRAKVTSIEGRDVTILEMIS